MSTSTSTSVKTMYQDGKKTTVKTITITHPDGKTTSETFVEEEVDDKKYASFTDDFRRRIERERATPGSAEGGRTADFKEKEGDRSSSKSEDSTSVASSASSQDGDGFTKFQKDCLKSHNRYRSKHGVKGLVLDKAMNEVAQRWAEKLLAEGKFCHNPDTELGENIFTSWSSDPAALTRLGGSDPVDSWYSEVKMFKYGESRGSPGTGHFSQVVWAASRRLGVGLASGAGRVIVVSNYDPAGNFIGKYADNVTPPV